MPRGHKGEKRPADVIGAAVMVGRIATGDLEETFPKRHPPPMLPALAVAPAPKSYLFNK